MGESVCAIVSQTIRVIPTAWLSAIVEWGYQYWKEVWLYPGFIVVYGDYSHKKESRKMTKKYHFNSRMAKKKISQTD